LENFGEKYYKRLNLFVSSLGHIRLSHSGEIEEKGEANMKTRYLFIGMGLFSLFTLGCSLSAQDVIELKSFPLDSLDGILTRTGIQLDKQNSSDGKGSLKIVASEPTTVRLFEVSGVEVDDARLVYRAKVRTEGVEGMVFLEMWCHFPGKGEFFSRGLQTPLTGTTNWTTEETPFFLKKGEKPDYVKLNLVIKGKGTAWIDDIRLLKGPLQ
jgi:hypothetical protein